MTVAGISEVKAKLSEYLAKVRRGEEVVITDRGRPVARIVPARTDDAVLAELERTGALRRGTRPLAGDFLERPRSAPKDADTLSALIEERRGGR